MGEQHRAEHSEEQETARRMESAHSPERFYPRPRDVLDDATLSRDEKLELLRNWQVQLQDRAGALARPQADRETGHDDVSQAIAEAIEQLGGH